MTASVEKKSDEKTEVEENDKLPNYRWSAFPVERPIAGRRFTQPRASGIIDVANEVPRSVGKHCGFMTNLIENCRRWPMTDTEIELARGLFRECTAEQMLFVAYYKQPDGRSPFLMAFNYCARAIRFHEFLLKNLLEPPQRIKLVLFARDLWLYSAFHLIIQRRENDTQECAEILKRWIDVDPSRALSIKDWKHRTILEFALEKKREELVKVIKLAILEQNPFMNRLRPKEKGMFKVGDECVESTPELPQVPFPQKSFAPYYAGDDAQHRPDAAANPHLRLSWDKPTPASCGTRTVSAQIQNYYDDVQQFERERRIADAFSEHCARIDDSLCQAPASPLPRRVGRDKWAHERESLGTRKSEMSSLESSVQKCSSVKEFSPKPSSHESMVSKKKKEEGKGAEVVDDEKAAAPPKRFIMVAIPANRRRRRQRYRRKRKSSYKAEERRETEMALERLKEEEFQRDRARSRVSRRRLRKGRTPSRRRRHWDHKPKADCLEDYSSSDERHSDSESLHSSKLDSLRNSGDDCRRYPAVDKSDDYYYSDKDSMASYRSGDYDGGGNLKKKKKGEKKKPPPFVGSLDKDPAVVDLGPVIGQTKHPIGEVYPSHGVAMLDANRQYDAGDDSDDGDMGSEVSFSSESEYEDESSGENSRTIRSSSSVEDEYYSESVSESSDSEHSSESASVHAEGEVVLPTDCDAVDRFLIQLGADNLIEHFCFVTMDMILDYTREDVDTVLEAIGEVSLAPRFWEAICANNQKNEGQVSL